MIDLENAWKDEEELQKVGVPDEALAYYEKIFEADSTFWQRLGHFIRAENKAGRKAKIVKDFALLFIPYGRTISNTSELATELISDNSKQKPKTMYETKLEKVKRFLKQKSTQSAIAVLATVVSAIFAGVEINPEVLTESLLGIVTALGALWVGVNTIIDMFRDEDA